MASAQTRVSAKRVIEDFYRQYMDFKVGTSPGSPPKLRFSKSFQKLIDQNNEVCRRHAGTDVCGFGSHGDVYLSAQEIDPKLTFQTSKFSASEPKPGQVEVQFNLYPSMKDSEGFYSRKIRFHMKKEAGRWVVDDIFYSEKSARQDLIDEIRIYKPSQK